MSERTARVAVTVVALLAVALVCLPTGQLVFAQGPWVTTCVSVVSDAPVGDSAGGSMSQDGHYAVFQSKSASLAGANGYWQIYLRDRFLGFTYILSVSPGGSPGNADSKSPRISRDGRFVAFESTASILVTETYTTSQIFVRDLLTQHTALVSRATGGTIGDGDSVRASISADGRHVAFDSTAKNLGTDGDQNNAADVFVRDRDVDGQGNFDVVGNVKTARVSVSSGGAEAHGESLRPSISANGRYVAFDSSAADLVSGDILGFRDIFLRDRGASLDDVTGVSTIRVSVKHTFPSVEEGNGDSSGASVSADGWYVAFESLATNLVTAGTSGKNVFVRVPVPDLTFWVSVPDHGGAGPDGDSEGPAVSDDGRYVAFVSAATNIVDGDTNGLKDVFVRDRTLGRTFRVSLTQDGGEASGGAASTAAISADGRYVGYASAASNLVPGDANGTQDVFAFDARSGIRFSKRAPTLVEADQPLAYTLVLTDANPMGHTNLFVTDTVPAQTTFQSGSMSASPAGAATGTEPSAPEAGNVLTWTIPTLNGPGGATPAVTLTFGVSINLPIANGTPIYNTAWMDGASASVATSVDSAPVLTMDKSVWPVEVKTNQPVTYTIRLTNTGTAIAAGVRITDALPAGAAFVSMLSGEQPSITSTVVVWSGVDVYPSHSLSFLARMPDIAGTYSNVVTATYELGDVTTGPTAPVVVRNPDVYLPLVVRSFSCMPDQFAPNQDRAHAYPLIENTTLVGNFCGAKVMDMDVFRFTSTGAAVKLNLTDIPAGCDYDLSLWRWSGSGEPTLVKASQQNGNANEEISLTPGAGGYLIEVLYRSGSNATTSDYRLQVVFR
jgi:uncharacterized repeat protein (TIGR01451 family)